MGADDAGRAGRQAGILGALALVYATLRYNVLGPTPWSDWPVYVLNKALAVVSLLACLLWVVEARRDPAARPVLLSAAFAAGLHAACYGYASWLTPDAWPGWMPPITLLAFLAGSATLVILLRPWRTRAVA